MVIDSQYFTILFYFFAGFILQAMLPLKTRKNVIALAISLVLVLVTTIFFVLAMFDQGRIIPPIPAYIITFFIIFFPFYFIIFRKFILPTINELTVILFTIFYWYFSIALANPNQKIIYIYLGIFPTVLVGYLALATKPPHVFWKFLAYSWYLVITCLLLVFQFNGKPLLSLIINNTGTLNSPVEALLSGMVFFILSVKIIYIFYLIPFPLKGQSVSSRIDDIKKYINLMLQKFNNSQLFSFQAILIVFGISMVLWINYQFKLITDSILINLIIILTPFFAKEYKISKLK